MFNVCVFFSRNIPSDYRPLLIIIFITLLELFLMARFITKACVWACVKTISASRNTGSILYDRHPVVIVLTLTNVYNMLPAGMKRIFLLSNTLDFYNLQFRYVFVNEIIYISKTYNSEIHL